jgi:hypothetical protein
LAAEALVEQLGLDRQDQIQYLALLLPQEEVTEILEALAVLVVLVVLVAALFVEARVARGTLRQPLHLKEIMAGLEAPTPSQIAFLAAAVVLEKPEIQMD